MNRIKIIIDTTVGEPIFADQSIPLREATNHLNGFISLCCSPEYRFLMKCRSIAKAIERTSSSRTVERGLQQLRSIISHDARFYDRNLPTKIASDDEIITPLVALFPSLIDQQSYTAWNVIKYSSSVKAIEAATLVFEFGINHDINRFRDSSLETMNRKEFQDCMFESNASRAAKTLVCIYNRTGDEKAVMPLFHSIEKISCNNADFTEFDLGKAALACAWLTHVFSKSSKRLDQVFRLMNENLLLGRCLQNAQEGFGDFSIKLAALARARELGWISDTDN